MLSDTLDFDLANLSQSDAPVYGGAGDSLLPDYAFCVAAILGYLLLFYARLPIWEDQGIYHYQAWCLQHGLAPYVDAINLGFPGTILLHCVARAISGADPTGLRIVDAAFQLALLLGTSMLLRAWGVRAPVRLLALTAYLLYYFRPSPQYTAQRETFTLPLALWALLPWLSQLRPAATWRWGTCALAGVVAAAGLWIKPTVGLVIVVGLIPALAMHWRKRRFWLGIAALCVGAMAASLVMIGWLAHIGSLPGFLKWAVQYAFGPYAEAKAPWPARVHGLWSDVIFGGRHTVSVLALLAAGGAVHFLRGCRAETWRRRRELGGTLALVVGTTAVILGQGKGWTYHYAPLLWALAVLGALLLSASRLNEPSARRTPAVWALCLLLAFGVGVKMARVSVEPTDGVRLARQLSALLPPGKTVVLFGFSPSLLSELGRPTPFPFVNGYTMCAASPPGSWPRMEILGSLARALSDPSVQYAIVGRVATWQVDSPGESPMSLIKADPAVWAILSRDYRWTRNPTSEESDVYERTGGG
jgi:hypothetical protein